MFKSIRHNLQNKVTEKTDLHPSVKEILDSSFA